MSVRDDAITAIGNACLVLNRAMCERIADALINAQLVKSEADVFELAGYAHNEWADAKAHLWHWTTEPEPGPEHNVPVYVRPC